MAPHLRVRREWKYARGTQFVELSEKLCFWPLMKMAEQRWQLPRTLSPFSVAFSRSFSLLSLMPTRPPLQVFPFYRRNWIDTSISLIVSSLLRTTSLGNETSYVSFMSRNRIIFDLLAFTTQNMRQIWSTRRFSLSLSCDHLHKFSQTTQLSGKCLKDIQKAVLIFNVCFRIISDLSL